MPMPMPAPFPPSSPTSSAERIYLCKPLAALERRHMRARACACAHPFHTECLVVSARSCAPEVWEREERWLESPRGWCGRRQGRDCVPAVRRARRAHTLRLDAVCRDRRWAPTKEQTHGKGEGRGGGEGEEREVRKIGVQCLGRNGDAPRTR